MVLTYRYCIIKQQMPLKKLDGLKDDDGGKGDEKVKHSGELAWLQEQIILPEITTDMMNPHHLLVELVLFWL
jgi:hypothetical protein